MQGTSVVELWQGDTNNLLGPFAGGAHPLLIGRGRPTPAFSLSGPVCLWVWV
jgi:hypothetical protein